MKCPRCQHPNPESQKFCGECGTPLERFSGSVQPALSYADVQRSLTEALDQQTATAEILRAISGSQTDAQPVFDAIVDSVMRLLRPWGAEVFLTDGQIIDLAAIRGGPPGSQAAFKERYPRPLTGQGAIGGCITRRTIVHIADIESDPIATWETRQIAQVRGARSLLVVPMLRGDDGVGAISATRTEAGGFSSREIELLKTFADQAVIAIENVRLFKELEARNRDLTEALDQQTATSEILGAISSSPTDLRPVFDIIAERSVRLCGGLFSSVYRFDGQLLDMVAHYNYPQVALERSRQLFPTRPGRHLFAARAILEHSVVQVPDVTRDPDWEAQDVARAAGFKSVLAVPMLRDGDPIGAIVVWHTDIAPFSDDHAAILKTFADQAVIAIENVRLFRELEARNGELTDTLARQTATSEVLRAISRAPTDAQPVFDTIAASALRLCGGAHSGVWLYDRELVHLAALKDVHPEGGEAVRRAYPRTADESSTIGRAIQTRAVTQIPDVLQDEAYALKHLAQAVGFRSWLAAPMLRDGEPIGVVGVGRSEPGPFPDTQIALLQTFADQAVIAIENVRLFKELQEKNKALTAAHAQVTEALEQQTATSEILRVISSSPTDVQPVFDTIVRNAVRLCGAVQGHVYRFDGELVQLVALHNFTSQQLAQWQQTFPRRLDEAGGFKEVFATGLVQHVADVESDRAAGFTPAARALFRALGARSALTVPMFRQNQVVGAIALNHHEVGVFTETHVELLKTFADQAVIAIENVRLFKELEARTQDLTRSVRELRALGEVGQAISSTLDLETVLTTIVSRAVQLSGLDGGVVFEYDESAEEFVQRAMTETGEALAEARGAARIRKGEGVLGRTAITLEPVQVADIAMPGAYEGRLREILIDSGIRAILAVPMVREGHLIGCLGVTRNSPGDFPAATIELLRTFATQSALAIQNARLFREIEQKSRELEAASRHKSEFLANMSHELRTPLNAIIGFSEVLSERMFGELNEKQEEYLKDIHASGQHLLSLINDILDLSKIEAGRMELEVTDFDLPMAIDNALTLVRERAGRRSIALHMTVDERLGQVQADERKIRQVVLNLLSNAIKFTPEGGRIEVRAAPVDGSVEVSVTDTGVGIAPEDQEVVFEEFRQVGTAEKKVEGTGLGLALSRKFIELHGGRIWVKSELGMGSTVTFTIPVRRGE